MPVLHSWLHCASMLLSVLADLASTAAGRRMPGWYLLAVAIHHCPELPDCRDPGQHPPAEHRLPEDCARVQLCEY